MVVKVPDDSVFAQAFLEPNDVVDIALPAGRFRLAYASGVQWFGTRQMFGPGHEAVALGGDFEVKPGSQMLRVELPPAGVAGR
ncbi:hypothetical protein [Ottowia sp.]|uniref:hypothetical protein n=1 Tax=Ottowia sp. TaxID=1898956 RepID=UPI0025E0A8F8|nr:hypothetical protein [Ottowia sp.]